MNKVLKHTRAGLVIGLAVVWCGAASSSPPVNQTIGSIRPLVVITDVTSDGSTVTITGSGFSGYAAGSGTSVTGKGEDAATIVFWSDTTIQAEFDSNPEEVTVNSVFGSATAKVSDPMPDTWVVKVPFLGAEFWVTFEQFAGILIVETSYASGELGPISVGKESGNVIFWMNITGTIFFGFIDRDAGTASGIVFDYDGASSIWFAEQMRPSIADLHHLLYRGSIPDPTDAPYGIPGELHSCLTCHEVDTSSGDAEFLVERECQVCHVDNVK